MGLYLRKSVRVGPFRFNLSKSGIGVSAGITGLRIGTGPRGNYVHMGRHGLYYRATIPSASRGGARNVAVPDRGPNLAASETHEVMTEIESADVAQMVDSSSVELLNELSAKRRRIRMWPISFAASGVLLLSASANAWPASVLVALLLLGVVGTFVAHQRDQLAKTVVLMYDFDAEMERAFDVLHQAADELASCKKAWHISAQGDVRDRKYHAGASRLVQRKATTIRTADPPYVKSNVQTVAIAVGRQTLHFFPDRVLVYDRGSVGAVGYPTLDVEVTQQRFIEDEGVPRDATVVDRTWKYVNKKGGPDRRFKDNPELPICLYDRLAFTSVSGLNEVVQVSRAGVGEGFRDAIKLLARETPEEILHRATDRTGT